MDHDDPALREPWLRLAGRLEGLAAEVRVGEPLSRLTTLRIGGPAGLVCPVLNSEDARRFLDLATSHDLPWTCLGGGSNILAADAGYAGLIMLVRSRELAVLGDAVRVGAGWPLDDLVVETLRLGLTGLEFASGIPGTVGGAVAGNAGCYGREIGELLVEATVLRPDGGLEVIGPRECGFAYRDSALRRRGAVVLDLVLALARGDADAASRIRSERIADRRAKHPWREPSAGSWFKNLPPLGPGQPRRAAGRLLDAVGAKQMREGGAAVFARHANIIVNTGGATARDVLVLADRMRDAVQRRFSVRLEPEVRYLTTGTDGA